MLPLSQKSMLATRGRDEDMPDADPSDSSSSDGGSLDNGDVIFDEAATRAARLRKPTPIGKQASVQTVLKKRSAGTLGLEQPPLKKGKTANGDSGDKTADCDPGGKSTKTRESSLKWRDGFHYKRYALDKLPVHVKAKMKSLTKNKDSRSTHCWVCLCPIGVGKDGEPKLCYSVIRVPIDPDGSERRPPFPRHIEGHMKGKDVEDAAKVELWVHLKQAEAEAAAKANMIDETFTHKRLELYVLALIVQTECPFEYVASATFIKLCNYLRKGAGDRMKSPKTFKRRASAALAQLQVQQSDLVKDLPSRSVSIGGDIWTDRRGRAVLAVTARYITAEFEARNLVLAVMPIDGKKYAHVVRQWFEDVMHFHGSKGQFLSTCTDGASNMTGADSVGTLPEQVHVHCGAHVGNLLDGILCNTAEEALAIGTSLVKYWNRHPDERLRVLDEWNAAPIPQAATPVATRWSSNYDMLAVLIRYRASYEMLCDAVYLHRDPDHALTPEHWQLLYDLYDHLSRIDPLLKVLQQEYVLISQAITSLIDICVEFDPCETVELLLSPQGADNSADESEPESHAQSESDSEPDSDPDEQPAPERADTATRRSRSGRAMRRPTYLTSTYAMLEAESDDDEQASDDEDGGGADDAVQANTPADDHRAARSATAGQLSTDKLWRDARRLVVQKAFQRFGRHLRLAPHGGRNDVLLNFFLTPMNKNNSWANRLSETVKAKVGRSQGEDVMKWYKDKQDEAKKLLLPTLKSTYPIVTSTAQAASAPVADATDEPEDFLAQSIRGVGRGRTDNSSTPASDAENARKAFAETCWQAWLDAPLVAKDAPADLVASVRTDPLKWWQRHHKDPAFERLAPVARRVLAIDASSAASERVFSTGGRLHTPSRNRMSRETLCALMMLKHADLMKFKDTP